MDLVPLVGVGVAAVLVAGVSARRAALGNRMDGSLETLKVRTRQRVPLIDVAMRRAPDRGTVLIKAVCHDQVPMANNEESLAEVIPTRVGRVPLHARRAS
jgi:hypothetical protein